METCNLTVTHEELVLIKRALKFYRDMKESMKSLLPLDSQEHIGVIAGIQAQIEDLLTR